MKGYEDGLVANACYRLFVVLEKASKPDVEPRIAEAMKVIKGDRKRNGLKRWGDCGLPSCESKQNLKACARFGPPE